MAPGYRAAVWEAGHLASERFEQVRLSRPEALDLVRCPQPFRGRCSGFGEDKGERGDERRVVEGPSLPGLVRFERVGDSLQPWNELQNASVSFQSMQTKNLSNTALQLERQGGTVTGSSFENLLTQARRRLEGKPGLA